MITDICMVTDRDNGYMYVWYNIFPCGACISMPGCRAQVAAVRHVCLLRYVWLQIYVYVCTISVTHTCMVTDIGSV